MRKQTKPRTVDKPVQQRCIKRRPTLLQSQLRHAANRVRQPVDELATELGRITGIPAFKDIVVKVPAPQGSPQLKDLRNREEKDAALQGRFSITNKGRWDALLLDAISLDLTVFSGSAQSNLTVGFERKAEVRSYLSNWLEHHCVATN